MQERMFTVEEVADRLHLNRVTIQRWIRDGRLAAINLGGRAGYRVRGEDVEVLLFEQYGRLQEIWFRVAQAIGLARAATAEHAAQQMPEAAQNLHEELAQWEEAQRRAIVISEQFHDVKGFYRPRPGQANNPIAAASAESVAALAAASAQAHIARSFEPHLVWSQGAGHAVPPLFHVIARGVGVTLCGLRPAMEGLASSGSIAGSVWCAECMRRAPSEVVAYFMSRGVHYVEQD